MKTIVYMKWIMMAVLLVSISACEINIDTESERRTYDLCSKVWTNGYEDYGGNYHYREFVYNEDRTGVEYVGTEYYNGGYSERSYEFYWHWTDSRQVSIGLEYRGNDFSWFKNIEISNRYLSGYMDGNWIEFEGSPR